MDNRDRMDHLLFDAAKARTDEMHLNLAWEAVQAAYAKKQKRRASMRRYTSMAAMLVLGLFMGLMAGRAGLIDMKTPDPQTPLPAATPAMAATPEPKSTPDDIMVDPPLDSNSGVDIKPLPDDDPGEVIVEPPPDWYEGITVPPVSDEITDPPKTDGPVDPPKTDNGDVELPQEIEIDPPKTDAFDEIWFGNVQIFPDFPKGIPEDFDISGLLPGWLPAGFGDPELFGSGWSSQYEGDDEHGYSLWGYIFVTFQIQRDISAGITSGLKIGEGRPQLMGYGAGEPAQNVNWAIRIDEEHYVYMEFTGVPFEDTVRVIESIK